MRLCVNDTALKWCYSLLCHFTTSCTKSWVWANRHESPCRSLSFPRRAPDMQEHSLPAPSQTKHPAHCWNRPGIKYGSTQQTNVHPQRLWGEKLRQWSYKCWDLTGFQATKPITNSRIWLVSCQCIEPKAAESHLDSSFKPNLDPANINHFAQSNTEMIIWLSN